jgi:uncharacterized protein (DUF58 family)
VTALGTTSAGASAPVRTTVTSAAPLPRVVTTAAGSAVLIVRDNKVVGITLSAATSDVPLQMSGGASQLAQVLPKVVRLESCASGSRLGVGTYSIVAVLGYRVDALSAAPADAGGPPPSRGASFVLVSAPAPIEITA